MKMTRWIGAALLLTPVLGCGDSGGDQAASSGQNDGWQTVVEDTSAAGDAGSRTLADTGTPTDSAQITDLLSDVLVAAETTDAALADAGAPELPQPEETTSPEGLPDGLTGQEPPSAQGMPSLAGVVDSTGAPALEDQLKDHWSVLWFYPMASTSG